MSIELLVLVALGGACGRSALMVSSNPDAGAHASDGSPAMTASNTSGPSAGGECPEGLIPCGKGEALRCYDVSRSKDHCGACGHACALGIACQAGACRQYRCKGALTFKALPFTSTSADAQASGSYPYHPDLGDFDGDGILDLVGIAKLHDPMSLLYGAGDGTFPTHQVIGSATQAWQAVAADVDGDGLLDLTSITGDQSAVTVRRGTGNRNAPLGEPVAYATSQVPSSLLLADFDADGRLDLVTRENGALELWRGQAAGRFERQARLDTRDISSPPPNFTDVPLATDWNGDGWLDLVYGASGSQRYRLNRGDGSFDQEVSCVFLAGAVGDLDHDGRPDLVSGSNLMLGIDGCHADKIVPLANWSEFAGVALADLDGDDNLDLVADADTKVIVRLGDGNGGLAQPLSLPATMADMSLFLFGDLNQDGKLDFIFVRPEGWGVFLNTCP
jgi:hypothetical protein